MRIPFIKYISWYLVVSMFFISIVPRVDAGLVPSKVIQLAAVDRVEDLHKIRQVLEMKAVSARLGQLGLTPEEVQQRMVSLSDQQIHQLALQLDELRVGQSDALGVIIALLVIVILVIVILKLTGHKVIVTR
ncbi:MAG: hypothetical protein AMK74_03500 [Nitrospira bacterium SM23_35]|jgi:hypothetical protein|nr:MAG: hypothetical protein AMK74_03500 [Nitrospira bacterium SM23_35]